jgi:outer membrane protein OmpA-like peptidoglycan-associated protein
MATDHLNKFTSEVVLGANVQLAEHVILKFDFRNQMYNAPTTAPGDRSHYAQERLLGVGLGFPFGFSKCPDSDGDGVCDSADTCPNTPAGCKVDAHGCPLDEDGDGVCDTFDMCPNTPHGSTVDSKGCPICVDNDGDGVCDDKDRCLNTPRGCKVDSSGCPIDSDGDGVCDGLDRCPNTPKGCRVDANGCPADEDGDGVCDGLDKCAHTRHGVKVDADGCEIYHVTLSNTDVHFATDKSVIPKKAYPKLDKVAADLLEYNQEEHVDKRLEVSGHCDSTGQDEHNMKLSRARANSVVTYLMKRKVPGTLLVANGYGYHKPIADNATAEGRAMNRRVEVNVIGMNEMPEAPKAGEPKKTVKKTAKKKKAAKTTAASAPK